MIYAVMGYEPVDVAILVAYVNRPGDAAVVEWASLYASLCPVAGIRTSFAWAQACHETDRFMFDGRAQPDWNNPCGLGVGSLPIVRSGVEVPNSADCHFPSKEVGVRAHLAHVGMYVSPYELAGFCLYDPRHAAHRMLENDGRQFGGPGRWAPNPAYGAKILSDAMLVLAGTV